MANNGERRVNSRSEYKNSYVYEGNAVRRIEAIPQEEARNDERSKERNRARRQSRNQQISENRVTVQKVGKGYVFFLAAVSAASVLFCVEYLQVKAVITSQNKQITSLETKLSDLKSDNDAYYNKVLTSVDVELVKNVAMNQLGMKYPSEEQVYVFDIDGNSYVRQYQDIPTVE